MITINDLINTNTDHDFVLFWGHTESQNGISKACLSQWYECVFESQGQLYSSAEQYMMAEKARLMGDEDTRVQILSTDNPQKAKKYGRQVRNFNTELWDEHKFAIVVAGNYNKFSQDKQLRDFLLSTDDAILVEASPYDNIWGIGMDASNPDARNPNKWKGQNLLGFALMEVRRMLRDEFGKRTTTKADNKDSDETTELLYYWTHGLGNMSAIFNGEDGMPSKKEICTALSWKTLPIPDKHVDITLDVFIPTKFMEIVKRGHLPEDMSDHWFMYCDESTIRYYRSWTGNCIFVATYKILGDVTHLTTLTANRKADEYNSTNPDCDIALFMALLTTEYGGYAADYWAQAYNS